LGGYTLLHLAVKDLDHELFTYLLRHPSVDVNVPTYGRLTALDIACSEFAARPTMIQRLRAVAAKHSARFFDEQSDSSAASSDESSS